MRCPKCGYNSFDFLDSCKKCNTDLSEFKAKFGLRSLLSPSTPPPAAAAPLVAAAAEDIAAETAEAAADESEFGFDFMGPEGQQETVAENQPLDDFLAGDALGEESPEDPLFAATESAANAADEISFDTGEEEKPLSFIPDRDEPETNGILTDEPEEIGTLSFGEDWNNQPPRETPEAGGEEEPAQTGEEVISFDQDWNAPDFAEESALPPLDAEGELPDWDPLAEDPPGMEPSHHPGQQEEPRDPFESGGSALEAEAPAPSVDPVDDETDPPPASEPRDWSQAPEAFAAPPEKAESCQTALCAEPKAEPAFDTAESAAANLGWPDSEETAVVPAKGQSGVSVPLSLGAGLVDLLILALIFILFVMAGELALFQIHDGGLLPSLDVLLELAVPYFLVLFTVCFGYFTLFHFLTGQTIGKMLFRLRVEGVDGTPLAFSQAFLRSSGGLICLLTAGIGFLASVFDKQGQGWNDRLAGTRVVRAAAEQWVSAGSGEGIPLTE